MQQLAARLDALLASSDAVALVAAISLSARCVVMQRTRGDIEQQQSASIELSSEELDGTFSSVPVTAAAVATLPPTKIVETYLELVAHCAAPFVDVYDPHPHAEWSVLRFHLPQWNIVALRDTAADASARDAELTATTGTQPGETLDFCLVVFSRVTAGETDGEPSAAR